MREGGRGEGGKERVRESECERQRESIVTHNQHISNSMPVGISMTLLTLQQLMTRSGASSKQE